MGKVSRTCSTCNRTLSSRSALRNHIDHVHLLKQRPVRFQCVFCPKGFQSNREFHAHIRSHIHERPYFCTLCDKAFSNKQDCKIHEERHDPLRKRKFDCPLCPKSFFTKSECHQHLRRHTLEKPHKCKLCERSFSEQGILNGHVKTSHSNERPFKCSVSNCQQGFKRKEKLARHVKNVHQGLGKVSCPICQRQLHDKFNLAKHLKIHSQVRATYPCDRCSRVYLNKAHLVRHWGQHHLPQ